MVWKVNEHTFKKRLKERLEAVNCIVPSGLLGRLTWAELPLEIGPKQKFRQLFWKNPSPAPPISTDLGSCCFFCLTIGPAICKTALLQNSLKCKKTKKIKGTISHSLNFKGSPTATLRSSCEFIDYLETSLQCINVTLQISWLPFSFYFLTLTAS